MSIKEKNMALNELEIKEQICDIGRRIYGRNMVAANDGNISVKHAPHCGNHAVFFLRSD